MTTTPPFPTPGDSLRMVRSGARLTLDYLARQGGQGLLYHGTTATGAPVAVKWYRPGPYADRLRPSIANLAARGRPHPAFAWPLDLVEDERFQNFGYVMSWVDQPPFQFLAEMLSQPEAPRFRVVAEIGREVATAFAALHAAGLCYRDISFGNLLVDPERAVITIVDNDNVGTDEGPVFVRGTARFMAPEVIRDGELPSTVTDLHSLAVFLFHLLFHGHPLLGAKTEASYSWQAGGHVSDSHLLARHLGLEPLFVFHPHDLSNRPVPGDPMLAWWDVYPGFVRDLFIQAFTTGLTDASLGARVTEGVWRRAFIRLRDSVSLCSCGAELVRDPDDPFRPCWRCGHQPPGWPLLHVRGHTVVLCEGAAVTRHHLDGSQDHRTRAGLVEARPGRPGQVVLSNLSDSTWTVTPVGEGEKEVRPGQRLGLRPMGIDFGPVRGSIRLDEPSPPAVPLDQRADATQLPVERW